MNAKTKPESPTLPTPAGEPANADTPKPTLTPRTKPRKTDAASRAQWKRARAIALGDLPDDSQ